MTAPDTHAASRWFTIPPEERGKIRLFCFPYAGGSSATFRSWGKALAPAVSVYPAHLPGRERRLSEKPFTRALSLVEAAAGAILPYLDRPFAFFGHSMGAMISFELARYLRRHNHPQPTHLFISGSRAPQLGFNGAVTYNLPDAEFAEELRRLNGTPREVLEHPELMGLMTPVLRADFEVCQTYLYTPEPALDCPVTAFGGLLDQGVSREMIEAWEEQTTARFRLWMLPGDHFFVNSAPQQILNILSRELQR
ncbi:MAG TPA: alpha/beta fold hydrolase [Pyrinomonadaceae bacterium]|jgi:medium-chain acyl-[acyl-carrier-protein] hydrolase